jgi:hypothetical protein
MPQSGHRGGELEWAGGLESGIRTGFLRAPGGVPAAVNRAEILELNN